MMSKMGGLLMITAQTIDLNNLEPFAAPALPEIDTQTEPELFFPFDVSLYPVDAPAYDVLERGLTQRFEAINRLLADLMTEQRIIKAGILPQAVLAQWPEWILQGQANLPSRSVYAHTISFDVIKGRDNRFYVQRDNINTPSGQPFPLSAGFAGKIDDAPVMSALSAADICDYDQLIREALDSVEGDGIKVVLSNPLCNPLFFEHAYLADRTRSELAFPQHLEVHEDTVYYHFASGPRVKVGAVYCTSCDDLVREAGKTDIAAYTTAALLDAYRAGNVAILNAPGSSLAEQPEIYHKMADIISFYTGEQAILSNVPCYRGDSEENLASMLARLDQLVLKEKCDNGTFQVVMGRDLNAAELSAWRLRLAQDPARYSAQEVVDFVAYDTLNENAQIIPRSSDFRVYASHGKRIRFWNSGL